ncbi:MAG TPA: hybrid sensor histidine kinase/response regulator [Polyangiaceae bacterium]|nr:hybrid sensor histidine kinase/response regulator [Polyangiaceae bacterium]
MCIGRTPPEALEVLLDALPTALGCELVLLTLPGKPIKQHAMLRGAPVQVDALPALCAALAVAEPDTPCQLEPNLLLWCHEAEVPLGGERGRLLVGHSRPLQPETDRVLLNAAAHLVGTTLETARVLELARRKDEFLAVLGHELRNPLAPIVTAVELLARHPAAARERQVIHRHSRHLARLVDDLLDISRVTSGHVELASEQVMLASVLERAVEIAAPLLSRNKHSYHVDDAGQLTVVGDPVRLAQIFGNLLTNAAKFTPPGGKIEILIEPLSGAVNVTVKDNGRGIAPDQLRRIFEPFVQADRHGDALRGGLGLGLAIVHSLVERHGGSVEVFSAGRGLGASFRVQLPTVAPRPKVAEPALVAAREGRAQVRVLVVDDNTDIAELLSESLAYEGFQTAMAYDAQKALDTWRSFAPHAAVLDLGLPGTDGYELAKTLRAEHGKSPTLIAATGYAQQKDRVRAEQAGFDCHLVKPVSVHDLVAFLDERVVPHET